MRQFYLVLLLVALLGQTGLTMAKEVTITHKGLVLNAELSLATEKSLTDGVILITHGGLAHRDMESLVYLRSLLKDTGYNTLAINLSLGMNNRHGMYDCQVPHRHTNDDAVVEISLWVDWLEQQGAHNITLLGHSRGGAQTALFSTLGNKPGVKFVVLMAPATKDNGADGYEQRYGQALAPSLARAQELMASGKDKQEIGHLNMMFCRNTRVSAESFISYYAPSPRLDTPALISEIDKPVLVVVAGDDEVVVGLDKKIAPLVDGKRVQMKVIEGAGHIFRDLHMDDAVEAIDAFLQGNAPQ